ncbi:MAG: cyclodeaminase/cyclohydrolase family protein [Thermoleophilaceae bacterium]
MAGLGGKPLQTFLDEVADRTPAPGGGSSAACTAALAAALGPAGQLPRGGGLLNFHSETLRSLHDVRVMLTPPEALRRAWKPKRDCTRRGYTTDEVLAELDRRQADAVTSGRPSARARRHRRGLPARASRATTRS